MAKTNLPMMIGSRYSRAKRRNGFISFISAISMSQRLTRTQKLPVTRLIYTVRAFLHLTVLLLAHWSREFCQRKSPKFLTSPIIWSFQLLKKGKYNVVLGRGLATQVGATVGDKVTFISPQGQSTPAGLMPRLRRFNVVGIFGGIGPDEFDSDVWCRLNLPINYSIDFT